MKILPQLFSVNQYATAFATSIKRHYSLQVPSYKAVNGVEHGVDSDRYTIHLYGGLGGVCLFIWDGATNESVHQSRAIRDPYDIKFVEDETITKYKELGKEIVTDTL
jgi:hypothetical protein